MIQFTESEVRRMRERSAGQPNAVKRLIADVKEILEGRLIVPETGIANWSLYYYCPDCSVSLQYDRNDGSHHKCPSCSRVFTGEPYDSSWWGHTNQRNYTAAFKMGLLYQITGEHKYAAKAVEIMLKYAGYYPDYEVHGDIPYNGPGRSGAQTLDEANFQRSFAMTYDLTAETMTADQKEKIKDNMLLPGAEFLIQHRHNQLHNHEVITNSAIAIIGLLFGREDFIQFAVYDDYGILYQLEHGMLADHMWFEGAFGYHFYALTSFFAYEKFALHTPHSHIKHPNYKAMMELLTDYLEPGFRIPMLNDTNYGHTSSSYYLYEFAFREIGGDKLAHILNGLYRQEDRDNTEALIYGAESIPETKIVPSNYHIPAGRSGSTILRGPDDRYLLIKHDCYGGEHDHYDRLGISYLAYGKRIAPDLGTTGYGAVLHYDYYKNTGSHNTVMIGEANQAPVNAVLDRFEERDGVVYVEASADWTAPYQMPDSFTIVQWQEENYRTVRMERKIAWTDDYFVEFFKVTGVPQGLPVDWVMHISGAVVSGPDGETEDVEVFSEKKPFKHLHDVRRMDINGSDGFITSCRDDQVTTHIFGAASGQTLFQAQGPDNPSVTDINYLIERSYGGTAVFAHVITSSDGPCKVDHAGFKFEKDRIEVIVADADKKEHLYTFAI